ncbi:MAG: glycoside hydrolase family 2 protein [Hyphomicrobiales bacterium]
MRNLIKFNKSWVFHEGFTSELVNQFAAGNPITLPHNAVELPYSYFDEAVYQKEFTYQKLLDWDPSFADKEVSLVFDGAMADSVVYLNGEQVGSHPDGYTPFEIRLTDKLKQGQNLISVKIDGSENPDIPPFGDRIDYLTYAGIYRHVWLKVVDNISIQNIKIETTNELTDSKSVKVRCDVYNPQSLTISGTVTAKLLTDDGELIAQTETSINSPCATLTFDSLTGLSLWDLDTPTLYKMQVSIATANDNDVVADSFGFRTAEFTAKGFFLNGKPLKIMALNRHQSFPYEGYAMGKAAQVKDADIMKNMLKCNLVRTSHYPQSKYFMEHCDRIGLLVFEEIPGWQHIGDEGWKKISVDNVKRMIERDWNHPSIILWGVRINESADDHDFYVETNRVAHELDSTRQTGGVRCISNSEMLEDVYTMNDFIQGQEELPYEKQERIALRPQQETTGLKENVPYLVTEYNGHMFPTKKFDQEARLAEHTLRHLSVLNASYGDDSISGCIGWCMFDYNTHADFGSGDRICYHGVLDMFREPKFAAYAYTSQCDPSDEVILKPVTIWARGERNICGVLPLIVLGNVDEIKVRYGDTYSAKILPDRVNYPHLPHPPFILDLEHFGAEGMGEWGLKWEGAEVIGYIDGKQVAKCEFDRDPQPTTLEVDVDETTISAEDCDEVRVIVRALDQVGNVMPFYDERIHVELDGPATLLGPNELSLRGGTTGFWLRSNGNTGTITAQVIGQRLGTTTINVQAK